MTARREERAYRNSYKKCIRGEATNRLFEGLIRRKIGLRSVEEFILRDRKTFKEVKGGNYTSKIRKFEEERDLVVKIMRRKLRENTKFCIRLRRDRHIAEEELRKLLGGRTRTFKMVLRDTKKNGETFKKELREKNLRKEEWLTSKYGVKYMEYEELTCDEVKKYGGAEIFNMMNEMKGETLRAPEVVNGEDEAVKITEEESMVLALGPKFCVRKEKLNEEQFEIELEECITKIKWDKMS